MLAFSFSFTLSLSSSAADEELNEVVFDDYGAYQEYLYFDFKPGDVVSYEPYVDDQGNVWDNSPAFYPSAAEPYYPDFNLNNLDLDSIPENIMNLIRSDNCGLLIRVWDTSYRIFVTRDCNFFYYVDHQYDSSGDFVSSERKTPFIGICTTNFAYSGFDPVCYFADYNYDGSIRSSTWTELTMQNFPSPYNSTKIGMRVFAWPFTTTESDNYYFGNWSNMKGTTGGSKRIMTVSGDGSTSTMLYCVQFSSTPSTDAMTLYFSDKISFPTYESQDLEVNKSIFSKLADIPDLIAEKIKSLFIPEDGYFEQFRENLDVLMSEHFGFLYEIPKFLSDFWVKIRAFNPRRQDYVMTFPALKAPIVVNGEVEWKQLTEEQEFDFDFLNNEPFSTIYGFYTTFCWMIFIVFLINLGRAHWNRIMGGSENDN